MYIGIDLGTSGLKAILMNAEGNVIASASSSLDVSRPYPLWSEQAPQDWWSACEKAMDELASRHDLAAVKGIGLTGQMHGATLLDTDNQVLRPAMLWNDGRSDNQCLSLAQRVPEATTVTGNLLMPGFTAPKVQWIRENEPEIFARIAKVLLPKDYLRFLLSGDFASDMSDAAGTSWLDVGARQWSEEMLSATGLTQAHMPTLFEGSQITGQLKSELAQRWGMPPVPIVAGGGDNAAGAVGMGIVAPGQAMLSLGTSGVYFAVSEEFQSDPSSAVHSFCHALPDTWHLMSVVLSAASCLSWFADNIARCPVPELLEEVANADINSELAPMFLPYLTGERTPHNNPHASGVFLGLKANTDRAYMTYAILEGVSFALFQGMEKVHRCGTIPTDISVIGGGARSDYWRQLLADVSGMALSYREGGEVGPALGAARLAQLALSPDTETTALCPVPALNQYHKPDMARHQGLQRRYQRFQQLYEDLSGHFVANG